MTTQTMLLSFIAVIVLGLAAFFVNKSDSDLQEVEPMPSQPESPKASVVASFGHLNNTYEDERSGLSLKYPDEMQVYKTPKGCAPQVTIEGRIVGFLMTFYTPSCPYPLVDPSAETRDDHKEDYALKQEGGEIRVHIFKSTDFVTSSGLKGLRQEYATAWSDDTTGVKEQVDPKMFSVRYIFYVPSKGLYVVTSENHNSKSIYVDEVDLFLDMEREIIDSIDVK